MDDLGKGKIGAGCLSHRKFYEVISQWSVPAQICQLVLFIRNTKGQDDGFVRELAFAKRLYNHFQ